MVCSGAAVVAGDPGRSSATAGGLAQAAALAPGGDDLSHLPTDGWAPYAAMGNFANGKFSRKY